jgi:two-component system sensor histidine kinase KdpD
MGAQLYAAHAERARPAAIFYGFLTPLPEENSAMGYAWAAGATVAATLVALGLDAYFHVVNVALVYLLAVVLVALRFRRGPVIAVSVLNVAAFNFFFIPPRGTLHVEDPQYLLTFAIMLAVGLVVSALADRVRARAKAQAALAIEAETERIRSALLASISHDLRTPLAVITGSASTLAERGERLPPEERAALAQSIFRQARDMSELVTKVLQMTRLETGAMRLERDWGSLGEIAGAVLRRLRERLSTHMVMLDLPDELPLVRVDATLIEQVLANLLENAARHTPPRTLIRLRAQDEGTHLVVSVEDFGPGLPEGELERVFEKFHRGAGLGLAICRAIVELHKGRIWAERLPGVGTAFRFTLPLETPPPLPAEVLAR